MVAFASFQVFFALAVLVVLGVYLGDRRLEVGSALLAAIGAAILGLYLMAAITMTLVEIG